MLILASGSQARRDLLRNAGVDFTVQPSGIDEAALKLAATGSPLELAASLAAAKALAVAATTRGALVIGADQVLVCGEEIYNKPVDLTDAARQLRRLRGRTHVLVTAVCLAQDGAVLWQHEASPRLTMRDFSDDELASYIKAEGAALLDLPGAYRLEGLGVRLFTAVEGDFFTILGLPLLPLLAALRVAGAVQAPA